MARSQPSSSPPMARTRWHATQPGHNSIRVQPGEYYVTGDPGMTIVTILGSCVAACIRNPAAGYGGMNHFMLPESEEGQWGGASSHMRYGNHAMETLINEVLKSGCRRQDLEIKLFGGANLFAGGSAIGSKNSQFATDYLKNEGLVSVASDLGGDCGRRIHYTPSTGKVMRLKLADGQADKLQSNEARYRSGLITRPVEGDIELFG